MRKIVPANTFLKLFSICGFAAAFAGCNSGGTTVSGNNSGVSYANFQTYTSAPGSSTYVTGVRSINDGSANVYYTGLYQSQPDALFQALIYQGPVSGAGNWVELNYPGVNGESVTSTSWYGPDSNGYNNITVVGCYTTVESGEQQLGLMYQGPLTGSGTWTTLTPPENFGGITVENTIAHSTMGGLVVGNTTSGAGVSRGFLYTIGNNTESYVVINLPVPSLASTAYGIWSNGSTSYTIAGGYSILDESGFDVAYLIDYDSATESFTNFESYVYNKEYGTNILTHFEGITSDGGTGYNLAADFQDYPVASAFVHVTRNLDGSFNSNAAWTEVAYPGAQITTANTVYENNILGVYSVIQDDGIKVPFVATIK